MQIEINESDVQVILSALEFITGIQADMIEDESLSEQEVEELIYQNNGCYKLFLAITESFDGDDSVPEGETIH